MKRPTCIMICAGKGDLRAARGLASRALRLAGIKADYLGNAEAEGTPRYLAETSNTEFERFLQIAGKLAIKEGWSLSPLDCYRD